MTKTWLITGAGRGMGVEFARAALAAGHNVVATGRNPDTVRSAVGAHENLLVTALDVTDPHSAEDAAAAAIDRFGRIDVLLNNAGSFVAGFFEELTTEQVRSQIETNLFGPMTVTRAVLPVMRRQRSGLVISISSGAGVIGSPSGSAYAASKFALEGWMESLTGEVEPFGIRTMIVEPGFFRTELLTPESTTFGELSIDDYDEARAESNAFWASMNGAQAGDPAKLARALVELADSAEPPLRWVAGEDVVAGRRGQGAAAARAGRRAPRAVDQPGPRGREGGRLMRGAVMHGPGEVRVEERDAPQIVEPTDAIIRVSAACVCGSDLWPYRGIGVEDSMWPMPMGHEYAGIVEDVGDAVTTVKPGQFVVGSFWATDNTCEICRAGYQSACVNRVPMGALGAQADLLRVPLADGTLIATPDIPSDDLVPSLLSASDVLGTGWFGAVAAEAGPGKTVAVVGDGAVGLLAVLAAKQLGAERIIAMSRHDSRQRLAREFGATDIVEARGDEGVAAIKELTDGLGAHSVVEAVGTQESMNQALHATRPGGHVGFVGVAHGVALDGMDLFWSLAHVHGGPAPVRRFLPELIDLIWNRQIDPGKVFDVTLPLDEAADGYRAMDQREAIKVLLRCRSSAHPAHVHADHPLNHRDPEGPRRLVHRRRLHRRRCRTRRHLHVRRRARALHARRAHRLAHAPARPDDLRHRGRRPAASARAARSRRSVPGTACSSSPARTTGTAPRRTASWSTSPSSRTTSPAAPSSGASTSPTSSTAAA